MTKLMLTLCTVGGFTGLILLMFPSGTAGNAGRQAVSVCYLMECMRLIWLALKGG